MGSRPVPSDERDAPESLKSSVPICMGKTRSWGKILGILDIDDSLCSLGGVLKSGEVSMVHNQGDRRYNATMRRATEDEVRSRYLSPFVTGECGAMLGGGGDNRGTRNLYLL